VVDRWLMVIRLACDLTSDVKDRALSTDEAPLATTEFIPQLAADERRLRPRIPSDNGRRLFWFAGSSQMIPHPGSFAMDT
jgi:hypothetical protein